MSDIFNISLEQRIWKTVSSLSARPSHADYASNAPTLPAPECSRTLEWRKRKSELLLRYSVGEILKWRSLITVPHLFLLTDTEGVAIYIQSRQELCDALERIGLTEGVSFSREQLGINGISMAVEQQTIVAVRGQEHDLKVFWPFNCLCVPIRVGQQAVGYLDLSFSQRHEIEFAIPILLRIVGKIEERLGGAISENGKQRLFELFDQYRLTPREKEAAYGWLRNYSVLRIAEEMNITEGTVRNMIKKVYAKTKMNDKGQFIRTFTGVL